MKEKFSSVVILFLITIDICGYSASGENYEEPPLLKAASLLPANILKAADYTIAEQVKNDGYTNIYTVDSKFGSFTAYGDSMLYVRLQEIEGITKLKEVSSSEAFAKAAGKQAMKPIEATAKIVENPVGTVKEIPGGIKRKFENIGRFVKKQKSEKPEESAGEESASGEATKAIFGVTAAHRKWAQKVGVDPYSTNPVLQNELERLAKVDAVASLSVRMAERKVPGAMPLMRAYDLAWGMDPQELQKLNEKRLAEMGVDANLSKSFFQNKALTPTHQTIIISALYELPKTAARSELIRSSLTAETERDAYLYSDSANMIALMKKQGSEISRFIPNTRIAVIHCANRFVAVIPADRIYWTKGFAVALDQFQKRQAIGLKKNKAKEIWLSGEASERFEKELKARSWEVRQRILTNQ